MKNITKYINFLSIASLMLVISCFNSVKAIPPEQILPNGIAHLEDLGGGWIPLNNNEAIYGGNLDEGSYWYQLSKEGNQVYLILQQLQGRTDDGKAIQKNLDVVVVPELANPNIYGILGSMMNNCYYPNGRRLEDSRVLVIVKYNQDTATPIKSFRANIQSQKWEIPPASLIKGLICQLEIP